MRLENNLSIKSRLQQYEQLGFQVLNLKKLKMGYMTELMYHFTRITDSIIGKWMRFDAA